MELFAYRFEINVTLLVGITRGYLHKEIRPRILFRAVVCIYELKSLPCMCVWWRCVRACFIIQPLLRVYNKIKVEAMTLCLAVFVTRNIFKKDNPRLNGSECCNMS